MYTLPQLHGILYTTEELVSVGILSFTLESCDLRVFPDLRDGKNRGLFLMIINSNVWFRRFLRTCLYDTTIAIPTVGKNLVLGMSFLGMIFLHVTNLYRLIIKVGARLLIFAHILCMSSIYNI